MYKFYGKITEDVTNEQLLHTQQLQNAALWLLLEPSPKGLLLYLRVKTENI